MQSSTPTDRPMYAGYIYLVCDLYIVVLCMNCLTPFCLYVAEVRPVSHLKHMCLWTLIFPPKSYVD